MATRHGHPEELNEKDGTTVVMVTHDDRFAGTHRPDHSSFSTAGRWRDMNIANFKLALRVLARRKVFTAISLVGITLTLVVLMVATAILDNVFAAGKPESQLDRMLS